jgi:insulysin
LENVPEIIKIVYMYINLLKKEGIKEWVFEEEKKLKDFSFKFMDEAQPADYASVLAGWMHSYPKEDVLSGIKESYPA